MAILTFNQKLFRRAFLLLTLILTCVVQSHADDFTYQGLTYTILTDNTCETKQGTDSSAGNDVSGDLIIPETVYDNNGKTYTVTSIGNYSFDSCTGLISVSFPNSVTSIGHYAFCSCTNLTSITIPKSVTSIDNSAFSGCSGLVKSAYPNSISNPFSNGIAIPYPANDTLIEDGIIWDSDKTKIYFVPIDFQGEFTVPNSVTSIGDVSFYACTGLTSVSIPNSVTSIGNSTFENCIGLTSITIPNSVTSIGSSAFSGCSGLTSVIIPDSITKIEGSTFWGCSGLTSVTIPNSVTSIEYCAFYDCSGLTSVSIPNSVTSIGFNAFIRCTGLTYVSIPNSVTSIGGGAFYGCIGISELNISDSETELTIENNAFGDVKPTKAYLGRNINGNVFKGNSNLSELTIGDKVTYIYTYSFSGCTGLTTVTIPNSVTSIGDHAFSDCKGLTSITIPNSVTSIGSSTFENCIGLTSITIPNSVTSIGGYAFNGCSGLTSITIPNSVTKIDDGAFYGCTGLTSVTIPNSVTKIYGRAFYRCTGLTSVTIPNSVTWIGDYAFFGCTGLTSISIGNSTKSIENYAFYGCDELKWIESLAVIPPVVQINTFYPYGASLLVTSDNYKTADYWKKFANIIIATEYTPTSTTFEADGLKYEIISVNDLTCRVYAIDGSVIGENLVIPETVMYKNRNFTPIEITGILINGESSVKSISIPSTATNISAGIIRHLLLEKLTVNAPISKNSPYLFASSVDELIIPSTINNFNSDLVTNSIGKITIEDSKTALTTTQFKGAIKEVYLGRNVSGNTFSGIISLEKVSISDNVTSIGSSTFSGCTGLKSVTIPNSVTSIGTSAFEGCTDINELKFDDGESVLSLSTDAFNGATPKVAYFGRRMDFSNVPCTALETVEFGKNVTSITSGAFKNAISLRNVTSRNTVPPTTDDTFSNETYLDGILYVPSSSIADYTAASGWKNFSEIKSLDSGVSTIDNNNEVTFNVENGAIYVNGDADVRIVSMNGTTVYSGRGETRINVAPGIYVIIINNVATKVVVK